MGLLWGLSEYLGISVWHSVRHIGDTKQVFASIIMLSKDTTPLKSFLIGNWADQKL